MAYINPQIQIDQAEQARADRNYASIGNAVTGVIDRLDVNRRRALDERRQMEQLALSQAQAAKDGQVKDAQLAKLKYESDELIKDPLERDEYKQKEGIARIMAQNTANTALTRDELIAKRAEQADIRKQEAEARKLENDKKAALQKAAIPGYEVADPSIIPTVKDAEEVKSAGIQTKNFTDSANSAIKRIETLDWKDRTGLTNNWQQLQQDVTDMQMAAKNMYDLGVLNGPDLSLVNKGLGSLSVVELNRLGPQAAMERVRGTISSAQQKLNNAAAARNYRPVQPKQQAPTDERAELEMLRQMKNRTAGK